VWFTLGNNIHPGSKPPAYYKLVILGVLAVYPLVLFTNYLLDPLLRNVPYLFGVFISVVAICLLMTYPVLPWLEKNLNSWLYPSSNKRQ
jgi:antibiotic biosynthesis monooxygenase (ABM) superfamily enzyme